METLVNSKVEDTENVLEINTAAKKTLKELQNFSKDELLKMVFDKSIANVKEKGHAQYAIS